MSMPVFSSQLRAVEQIDSTEADCYSGGRPGYLYGVISRRVWSDYRVFQHGNKGYINTLSVKLMIAADPETRRPVRRRTIEVVEGTGLRSQTEGFISCQRKRTIYRFMQIPEALKRNLNMRCLCLTCSTFSRGMPSFGGIVPSRSAGRTEYFARMVERGRSMTQIGSERLLLGSVRGRFPQIYEVVKDTTS